MRKSICLLLLLVTLHVSAQELHFIPKAGLTLANSTNSGGNMRAGLNVGISAEYMITPVFATEAGLYYSMQGSKFDYGTVDLKHDYLNIPILAKFYVYKGFHLFAGPQIGFNVSANKLAYGSKEYNGELTDSNITRAVDFLGVIGAGYLFFYGLTISANVNIGLTNKLKGDFEFRSEDGSGTFKTDGNSSKNTVLQVNFGYRF